MTRVLSFLAIALLWFPATGRADIDAREVTTPGGLTVWHVEDHSIPFTAVKLLFAGGTSLDAAGKRGRGGASSCP